MNSKDLMDIKDVTVHYEKAVALENVSLNVTRGTVVALIGPNGAGKSTLLRAISGLKALTSGQIWIEGKRIDGTPPMSIVRLGVAHVPEGRRLFPYMSVLHNLEMGAYTRTDKNEIENDMEEVFSHFPILKERRMQKAGTLSGGQQQMVAIARSLMAKPKLLLLDEPSLGLSPLLVKEIENILKNICRSNVSILLVEQNAELALSFAAKVYVMSTGRIVSEGSPEELSESEFVRKAYLGR
jgi:branched-chain amino acid transport system ATP-binding protein